MSKYEPLTSFLEEQALERVPLTFREVERVLGFKLPASALKHRPWWANTGGSHVQSGAWLEAGYETESVDMQARRLVFRRMSRANASLPAGSARGAVKRSLDNVFGCLGGTVRIHDDVTRPSHEMWSDQDGAA